ncbi:phage major capsid protein [Tsukamurella paurometabola]|uniref:Phage major capsid protein n=1 Tax=Tsukamurella paurometabola TaxID=2061 RepID=A0ABS5NI52_TSUPA|nr:phage major capsid protein [Tsukamurella paurometabola]MBS4103967.1 phage major capsid protein [Tsukamurella paurometabola]
MVARNDLNRSFLPTDFGPLVDNVVDEKSLMLRISTVVSTDKQDVRFPIWQSDPDSDFSAEGATIPLTAGAVGELIVQPVKIAARSILTNEAVADSSPSVLEMYSKGIARSIAVKADAQFFSDSAAVANVSYAGIRGLAGIETLSGVSFANLDDVHEAVSVIEGNGGTPTHITVSPDVALALKTAKTATGSNVGLFSEVKDGMNLAGLIANVSRDLPQGTALVTSQDTLFTVRRLGTELVKDTSVSFAEDSVQLRGVTRLSWGSAAPSHIALLTTVTP